MSSNRIPREALDELNKRKVSQEDLQPSGEKQSRKRLRERVSHEVRQKRPSWTESVEGRE